jgi:hypothetical protein
VADEIFSLSVVVVVTAAKRIAVNTIRVALSGAADSGAGVAVTVLASVTSTGATVVSVVELWLLA